MSRAYGIVNMHSLVNSLNQNSYFIRRLTGLGMNIRAALLFGNDIIPSCLPEFTFDHLLMYLAT